VKAELTWTRHRSPSPRPGKPMSRSTGTASRFQFCLERQMELDLLRGERWVLRHDANVFHRHDAVQIAVLQPVEPAGAQRLEQPLPHKLDRLRACDLQVVANTIPQVLNKPRGPPRVCRRSGESWPRRPGCRERIQHSEDAVPAVDHGPEVAGQINVRECGQEIRYDDVRAFGQVVEFSVQRQARLRRILVVGLRWGKNIGKTTSNWPSMTGSVSVNGSRSSDGRRHCCREARPADWRAHPWRYCRPRPS